MQPRSRLRRSVKYSQLAKMIKLGISYNRKCCYIYKTMKNANV